LMIFTLDETVLLTNGILLKQAWGGRITELLGDRAIG